MISVSRLPHSIAGVLIRLALQHNTWCLIWPPEVQTERVTRSRQFIAACSIGRVNADPDFWHPDES